jgi:N-formylglutamate amidohydrolase
MAGHEVEMTWRIKRGHGPVVATAIHSGHRIRSDMADLLKVDEVTRFREEDPFTDRLTEITPTRVVVETSRFEFDLNRPPDSAVYLTADDAWGIDVWHSTPPLRIVSESLARYERFYGEMDDLLGGLLDEYGRVLVLDLHSYCHRRGGPDAPPDDPAANPDVNIGTGSVDRRHWSRLIGRLRADLREFDFNGRQLDVRENVRFRGGYLSRWVNGRFPGRACAVAIEFKKFFMDEWTGELDSDAFGLLHSALAAAIPGLIEELEAR